MFLNYGTVYYELKVNGSSVAPASEDGASVVLLLLTL
jgi:hypothetical protein